MRQGKDGSSRQHVLKTDMLSLPRSSIFGVTKNKEQFNKMLVDALMNPDLYTSATQKGHTLTLAGVEDYPMEITNGVMINRRDIISRYDEADLIIAQHAILKVTTDFYDQEECTRPMFSVLSAIST